MIYLLITGLVVAGFLVVLGVVGIATEKRVAREHTELITAARLAHDAQADELNRATEWRD